MLHNQDFDILIEDFRKLYNKHLEIGFVENYNDVPFLYDQYQTHFYISEVMKGILKHKGLPRIYDWYKNVNWSKIYTDKYIYSNEEEIGSFEVNGLWVKDRYFDYATACIPYADDINLQKYIHRAVAVNEFGGQVYKEKPSRMVYLVASIINKNNENFPFWYTKMVKNLHKFEELGPKKVDR